MQFKYRVNCVVRFASPSKLSAMTSLIVAVHLDYRSMTSTEQNLLNKHYAIFTAYSSSFSRKLPRSWRFFRLVHRNTTKATGLHVYVSWYWIRQSHMQRVTVRTYLSHCSCCLNSSTRVITLKQNLPKVITRTPPNQACHSETFPRTSSCQVLQH